MFSLSFIIFKTGWFNFLESCLCLQRTNSERYYNGIWKLSWELPYGSFTHFWFPIQVDNFSNIILKMNMKLATCNLSSVVYCGILSPTCQRVVCMKVLFASLEKHDPSIYENLLIKKAYLKILICQENQTIYRSPLLSKVIIK